MEALELVRDTEPLLPEWYSPGDLPGGASGKEPTQEMPGAWAQSLGREGPLEKGMVPTPVFLWLLVLPSGERGMGKGVVGQALILTQTLVGDRHTF